LAICSAFGFVANLIWWIAGFTPHMISLYRFVMRVVPTLTSIVHVALCIGAIVIIASPIYEFSVRQQSPLADKPRPTWRVMANGNDEETVVRYCDCMSTWSLAQLPPSSFTRVLQLLRGISVRSSRFTRMASLPVATPTNVEPGLFSREKLALPPALSGDGVS
jgi:hypothetical protein